MTSISYTLQYKCKSCGKRFNNVKSFNKHILDALDHHKRQKTIGIEKDCYDEFIETILSPILLNLISIGIIEKLSEKARLEGIK